MFAGASSNALYGLPFWVDPLPGGTTYPGDTITGADISIPTQGVSLTAGKTYDLATVIFTVPGPTPATDQFQVSLINDPLVNYFTLPIPEPSSSTVVALSSLSGLMWYWRRRRQMQS